MHIYNTPQISYIRESTVRATWVRNSYLSLTWDIAMINFSLPDAEDENLGWVDIGEGADLLWLGTLFVICQIITWMKYLRGDRHLCLFSISIFRRI